MGLSMKWHYANETFAGVDNIGFCLLSQKPPRLEQLVLNDKAIEKET
jgi:hypothetical protein